MTRYARRNKGNQRQPHDATPWSDPQEQSTSQNRRERTRRNHRTFSATKQELQSKTKAKHKHKKGGSWDKYNTFSDEHSRSITDDKLSRKLASPHKDSSAESAQFVKSDLKKERRREDRRLKRIQNKTSKMVCYHCREAGHGIADCPKMLLDEEQGTGICFRCGSTEHEVKTCTAKLDPAKGDFPFAKCFICQEPGHLARSCPDNPRGLYPMGGSCRHCGSVEHMNQHCPYNTDMKQSVTATLPTLRETLNWSADAEVDEIKPRHKTVRLVKKKTPKVVKF